MLHFPPLITIFIFLLVNPYILPEQSLKEFSFQVILLSILLTLVLAVANAYLALKVGLLTSASIPAAMISMGILRFSKSSNILQNNLVQTAASAGEAVAGGIVYTVPALIMIHYWQHFPYWTNVGIAFVGGVMGVLFSIPIRHVLVAQQSLPFPEGRAIAEVLKIGNDHGSGLKPLLWGGILGAGIELLQTGFKVLASSVQMWYFAGRTLIGFGGGFAPGMIGAGYLMGFSLSISIFMGAILGWLITVPILGKIYSSLNYQLSPQHAVVALWDTSIRYMGVGAMLLAGLWTLGSLLKPLLTNLKASSWLVNKKQHILRTERDLPLSVVILTGIGIAVLCYWLFNYSFPWHLLQLTQISSPIFLLIAVAYVLVLGFIIAGICAYFSGLVGVTATPGSAVIISGLLIAALSIRFLLNLQGSVTSTQWLGAAAVTILVGSIIEGAAAIANDNAQDLKVGHLLGATPWKQQCMLILGVSVASLVIPLVMETLFQGYGVGDVLPDPNMDISQTLPAPPAALMAAVTLGVFNHGLPWHMVGVGCGLALVMIITNYWLTQRKGCRFSVLGVAIGIYLPLQSSIPLCLGGLIAGIVEHGMKKYPTIAQGAIKQRGMLLACGLLAGSALMDVGLAIPFALTRNPDQWRLVPLSWEPLTIMASLGVTGLLVMGFCKYTLQNTRN